MRAPRRETGIQQGEAMADLVEGLRQFITDGCSARPEDRHDALHALDALVAERTQARQQAELWRDRYNEVAVAIEKQSGLAHKEKAELPWEWAHDGKQAP